VRRDSGSGGTGGVGGDALDAVGDQHLASRLATEAKEAPAWRWTGTNQNSGSEPMKVWIHHDLPGHRLRDLAHVEVVTPGADLSIADLERPHDVEGGTISRR
jgi:hypothetical protein